MSEAVEVTGADRERADDIYDGLSAKFAKKGIIATRVTSITPDDDALVQAFASHRHEATRALSAQVEELREVLQEIVGQAGPVGVDGWHSEPIHGDDIAAARALLAKHKETGA